MRLTERTLRTWRAQALLGLELIHSKTSTKDPQSLSTDVLGMIEIANRILRLTQELLDRELVEKLRRKSK